MPRATSIDLPALMEHRFLVYYGDMSRHANVAEVTYRLQHGNGHYELGTRAKAIGVVALFYSGTLIQDSIGRIGPEGFRPERYTERRGKRPERAVRFDHEHGQMIGGGNPAEVPLPPGTQDRLSIFYQLGLLARRDPARFTEGRRFTVPLASMKRVDEPTFTVVGLDEVKTGRGPIPALRVNVRNEPDPTDPVIDIWLATSDSMLPARIRVTEHDGKIIDQVLLPAA